MSAPALDPAAVDSIANRPAREHPPELLEMKRRAEELGIEIRLPTAGPDWQLPEPLPIPADVVSKIVVQQRRSRGF